jgi:hypothetical protein
VRRPTTRTTAAVLMTVVAFACGSPSGSGFGAQDEGGSGARDDGGDDSSFAFGGSSGGSVVLPGHDGGGSSGGSSGPVGCDPTCAAAGGTCSGTSCTITENPGGIATAEQTSLQGSGTSDTSFAWLYPYDRTVFPRGLVSPTMQFGGGASDAEYVHITSTNVDYKGYFAGGAQGAVNLSLSQKAWDAVLAAIGATDTAKVAVTKTSGGSVTGPITESWSVAQGTVRGTVYHETYNSPMAGAVGIMRLQVGAAASTVLKSGCGNVCHSASADGSTLVADTTLTASASYDLKTNASLIYAQSDDSFAYGGLYPDGSILMSSTNYLGGLNTKSQLYNTQTGATIAASGWDGVITMGGTTSFSPDGSKITFVHEDLDDGHTVSMMDFDRSTTTFSNLVDLSTNSSLYVAWPAFMPDEKSVVYHLGSSAQFESGSGATADLFIVNVSTHAVHRLDALGGYTGSGTATYLPSADTGLSSTPTVLPEAVGGYFWVVFTSHRQYGNLLASKASGDALGKLWVSAIDIDPTPGTDPSHPAFYLDGQELNADNLRGFWTLPPCEQNGTSCTSGDQCCSGFCRGSGSALTCVTKPAGCSNQYESCTTASDCCTAGDQCINGRCALPAPPQ